MLPEPKLPKESGRPRPQATNSASVVTEAGTAGPIMKVMAPVPTRAMKEKSLIGSYGKRRSTTGACTCVVMFISSE